MINTKIMKAIYSDDTFLSMMRQEMILALFTWSQEELAAGNRSKASRIFKIYNRLREEMYDPRRF